MKYHSRHLSASLSCLAVVCLVCCHSEETVKSEEQHYLNLYKSITEIPEVTSEEIAAAESLKNNYEFFTFGMIPTTESFMKDDGRHGGYIALLCEWLSSLFDIPFNLALMAPGELQEKLNSREIDFSGNVTPTEERRKIYNITDTIAERKLIKIRLEGSRSTDEISEERPVKYALSADIPAEASIAAVIDEGTYELIYASNFSQAYNILVSGKADAYISTNIAESAFIDYDNVIIEDFFPLIFSPISIATAKNELQPVISVINKALRNGAMPYLSYLYNKGYEEYKKHKLFSWLTSDERAYIGRMSGTGIPVTAFNSNYPLSFYNERENEWQGIYFDLLGEISALTGLVFEVAHNEKTAWPEIYEIMTNGKAAFIPELTKTKEREENFIWSKTVFSNDYYALISKSEHHNITLFEILHENVGVARNTNYAAMFRQWFPSHNKIVEYDGIDNAIKGLMEDEVDLVMTTQRRLMHLTHYQEIVGYKANLIFNQPIETRFAFNKNETLLKSIIDKSSKLINIDGINIHWTQKTYDYRVKLIEAQRPLLFGAIVLTLIVLILILSMFYRSHDDKKKLAQMVAKTNEANRLKNVSIISMETILNSIDAMIYVTNPETSEILFINDTMKKHYKIKGNCVGKKCYELMQKDLDRPCDFCPCHQLNKEPSKPIVWEEHSTLTKRIYHNTDRYIDWPNGQTVHMQHSVDTTELVAAREFAERSSRYKSSFLANMSHEIRTPMNAILGIAEIQLHNEDLQPEIQSAFNKIYESGDLLVNIINDILDLSKIDAGKLELSAVKYDIPSLINDTAQLNCLRFESKPIIFTLNVDENTPHYFCGDELRIKQILNNVLSNAFKYTSEGKIEFYVSFEPDESDDESAILIFRVSDTGQGMTNKQIHTLFDEYSRFNIDHNRDVTGTGLGMSITMRLIDLMNGTIDVESEPNKGSVFTIKIPQKRAGPEICGQEAVKRLKNFHFQGPSVIKKAQFFRDYMPYGSVLIVDDVESNIYVSKGMLIPYGLNIDTASSGFDAIEKIKNGNVYDIIFMDHMMPKMDGIETVKILRGMNYTNSIVALTANAIIGRAEMFIRNGFDGFISKPIDSRELNSLLNDLIRDKKSPEVVEEARLKQGEFEIKMKNMIITSQNTKINTEKETLVIRDIDNAVKVLEDFKDKLNQLDNSETELYITTVHGIKSVLTNIGEKELSETAYKLEKAGVRHEYDTIAGETESFLNELKQLGKKVKMLKNEAESNYISLKISAEDDIYLREKFTEIKNSCESFDKKSAKAALDDLRLKTWTSDVNAVLDEIALHILHSAFKKAAQCVQNFLVHV